MFRIILSTEILLQIERVFLKLSLAEIQTDDLYGYS